MSEFPDFGDIAKKRIDSTGLYYRNVYDASDPEELSDSEARIVREVNELLWVYSLATADTIVQWLCEFVDWYEDERGV